MRFILAYQWEFPARRGKETGKRIPFESCSESSYFERSIVPFSGSETPVLLARKGNDAGEATIMHFMIWF